MGKGKGEMVVADDVVREHVRKTIYWGKDNDGGGKGKGKNEVGKGKNRMVVADHDVREHVRADSLRFRALALAPRLVTGARTTTTGARAMAITRWARARK